MAKMKMIGKLMWLLLAFFMVVSCGKESFQDYRDTWVGEYSYTCHKCSWNPRGDGPESVTDGIIRVDEEEDSCVRITPSGESKSWLCKVNPSGGVKLIGSEYRGFHGQFYATDSMYLYFTNFSPGAGSVWEYECKRNNK
ncbi:MAG: hypothetical protein K6E93_07565 [Bacteroidales bacterium]|nr:hypothetical protein [Bacteroidales bacterium]